MSYSNLLTNLIFIIYSRLYQIILILFNFFLVLLDFILNLILTFLFSTISKSIEYILILGLNSILNPSFYGFVCKNIISI
mgnify:CR=1 FL=1